MQNADPRALCVALASLLIPAALVAQAVPESALSALEWREVGPYRGGRCAAVAGIPSQPDVYYFGSTGGGVWKTVDGGRNWKNVSDGTFGGSIGAVAVSEIDPNVIYVGGGEKTVRGNVSHGDGMWKSTDAGRTWKHVGLADSRHISRVRIHPRDPDVAYAAVMGHLYGPNPERGVFRTRDGGASWERVLHVDDEVGAVDLAMDPTNPRILYAGTWRVKRTPYSLESGGEGSGLWKSTDSGDTWEEITRNEGLPEGDIGICGIAVSKSDPDNLYAIVEAKDGGVFRSRDAGKTWRKTNSDRSLRQRAWYYTRIYADPADADACYVLNVGFHRSGDGGRTFSRIGTPHGDNHDLWIDPADPRRMIEGNDGGANVSYDGGESWSPQDNQPTAQIYRVSTDNAFPYRILGAQQDNSAFRIRSRSASGGSIGIRDWEPTAGGESGHIVARPDDPDVVYGGSYGGFLTMVNHRTEQRRAVNVWPDNPMGWGADELRYRFQWNFPLFFSPHDPDVLYTAAQVMFVSRDGGASWEQISEDLTRDEKSRQGSSGGPITKDNTSVEYYCTIFATIESPHEAGVLWAGSDDGLLHVTRDGGESWQNVTPPTMPEWAQINSLEAHPLESGGLYVAATRYKSDDFRPYLFKTLDYGATWTEIHDGIDPEHFTRVVRADPDRQGLLYAGTERGVYVSFDDGGSWQPLQQNLPIVPVTDLAVKDRDLIAATQGRGFWVLDDLTVLHQVNADVAGADAHLYQPRATYRMGGRRSRSPRNAGTNPRSGVVLHYQVSEEPADDAEVKLELIEPDGTVIKTIPRGDKPNELAVEAGLNTFEWNMRYADAEGFPGMVLWNRRMTGPLAVPGTYQARLTVGEWNATVPFEILADPRSTASHEDRVAQFELAIELRDQLTRMHGELKTLRDIKTQIARIAKQLGDGEEQKRVGDAAKAIEEQIGAIEKALYQTKNQSAQDPLNFPIRLNDKLAGLMSHIQSGDHRPTVQAYQVRDELTAAIEQQLSELAEVWARDLPALNQMARDAGVELIESPTDDDDDEDADAGGDDDR